MSVLTWADCLARSCLGLGGSPRPRRPAAGEKLQGLAGAAVRPAGTAAYPGDFEAAKRAPQLLHPLDARPPGPLWFLGHGYSFISDLLYAGLKRPLLEDDVPPLPQKLRAWAVFCRLSDGELPRKTSLARRLWRLVRWNALIMVFHGLAFLVGKLSTPFAFWWLLEALKEGDALPWWHGWAAAATLTLLCMQISVFIASGNYMAVELATVARQATSALVFDKVLSLPVQGLDLGSISSALTLDAERVYLACVEFGFGTPAVGMLIGGSAILVFQVQWAAVPAVLFLLLAQLLQRRIQGRLQAHRGQLSKWTDCRVSLSLQLLQGIRPIRMNGWDLAFQHQIEELRFQELAALRLVQRWKVINFAVSTSVPIVCTVLLFAVLVLIEGPERVTPERFFMVISVVNPCIRSGMDMMPRLLSIWSEAGVALTRMEKLMAGAVTPRGGLEALVSSSAIASCATCDESTLVTTQVASFAWPGAASDAFRLRDVSFTLRRGGFVCILGQVGSGKSALVAALLGELPRVGGLGVARSSACARGPFLAAYCGQQPWIRTCSARDNILSFARSEAGRESIDEASYRRALASAQLLPDIASWPLGDDTEVGERGLVLSGGQKARLSIARGAYAGLTRAVDAVFLDDVLAALDGPVAQAVAEDCILDSMSGVARVLTLSSPHWILGHADEVVIMEGGKPRIARPEELSIPPPVRRAMLARRASAEVAAAEDLAELGASPKAGEAPGDAGAGKLYKEEQRNIGNLDLRAISKYFGWSNGSRSASHLPILGVVGLFMLVETSRVAVDAILAWWATVASSRNGSPAWLGDAGLPLAAGLCMMTSLFALIRSGAFMCWAHKCSHSLYGYALHAVAAASVPAFFDVTPSGRLINSFSRDVDVLDSLLPDLLHTNLTVFTDLILALVVCAITTPTYIVIIPFLLYYAFRTRKLFGVSARELKRMDGVSRSSILVHALESAQGLLPLRASGVTAEARERFLELLDGNARHFFHLGMLVPWMIIRMNMAAACFAAAVSFSAIALKGILPGGALGLGVAYSLNLMGKLQTLTRYSVELEQLLTSAERLDALLDAPASSGSLSGACPPLGWPAAGQLDVRRLSVRYRDGLPSVLKDVSFSVPAGSKLGVVGRSGCGKSTLMQALLRIVDAVEGQICIDGVDITSVAGTDLRSRISVIAQDPYLWSGSLRVNLDPTHQYTDAAIVDALERCQILRRFASGTTTDDPAMLLAFPVEDAGANLSVGERQLLCLCRALLRGAALCLLDEATANIDAVSEAKIQAVLAEAFAGATMVIVAHRLQTVRTCDFVLRLDAGRAVAFGAPREVLHDDVAPTPCAAGLGARLRK